METASSLSPEDRNRFCGLVARRERWGLSKRGWAVVVLIGALAAAFAFFGSYPFLAVTHRIDARILVVEGWVHEYAARAAVAEFRRGGYDRVFTTGGPVVGSGGYVNDFNTAASVGADLLKKAGIPSEKVQMVPTRVIGRDRTFSAALALDSWMRSHGYGGAGFNILTEDAHARRSRLLFRKAFGSHVAIGVISVPSPDYDANRWWRYSEGVRTVIGEGLAYLYARFLFWPGEEDR